MKDETSLILTVVGDDRPGLVEALARVIAAHGGNWCEASMAQLAGKFAGIVHVTIAPEKAMALERELSSLPGLAAFTARAEGRKSALAGRRLTLELVGHDRPGIVKEVAEILAAYGVNVERLDSSVTSAPMSAEMLFHCRAELTAPASLDARALKAALEKLSGELMVDIHLGESL